MIYVDPFRGEPVEQDHEAEYYSRRLEPSRLLRLRHPGDSGPRNEAWIPLVVARRFLVRIVGNVFRRERY
jgi:hypothetical protein